MIVKQTVIENVVEGAVSLLTSDLYTINIKLFNKTAVVIKGVP